VNLQLRWVRWGGGLVVRAGDGVKRDSRRLRVVASPVAAAWRVPVSGAGQLGLAALPRAIDLGGESSFPELRLREIQQHQIRAFLDSFENDFATIGGDVEVADVEVGREVG
jgi:hypothetical protein